MEIYVHNWSRKWKPTPVFLPGKFHGQGSLEGYGSWGHKELDKTEQLSTLACVYRCIYVCVYIYIYIYIYIYKEREREREREFHS